MRQIITHFHESIYGIEEFADIVVPILQHHAVEKYKKNMRGTALYGIINTLNKSEKKEENTKLIEFLENTLNVKVVKNDHHQAVQIEWDDINDKGLTRQFNNALYADSNEERLFESSLMSLTNTIELMFARILHAYYDIYPPNLDEKTLSFKSIKSLATVEEIKQMMINQVVEGVLRGSLIDWYKVLRKQLKIELSFLNTVEDDLKEIFQRRNIVVHNGGIINNIYLSTVSQKFSNNLKSGDKVQITRDYIRNSAQIAFISFSLVGWKVWGKTRGLSRDIEIQMTDTCYVLLEKKDFNTIILLTKSLLSDFSIMPSTKGVLEIYQWICGKLEDLLRLEESKRFIDNPHNYPLLKLAKLNISQESRIWIDSLEDAVRNSNMDFEDLKKEPLMNFLVCTKEMMSLLERQDFAKYFKPLKEKTEKDKDDTLGANDKQESDV